MAETFDVIIVGAGPAGTTAGLTLAQAGLKVAIFERGEQPGSKNMFGGVLYYTNILDRILPELWQEAPIERYVTKHILVFMSEESWASVAFTDKQFAQLPYNAVTLLRAKFDRWMADKAQEAGALVIPETLVDDLVRDGERVVGVKTTRDDGTAYADVVIIAEGANSLLVKKAGLNKVLSPSEFAIAAKEVLALPAKTIEQRFGLQDGEGAAYSIIGAGTDGLPGGAFIYTNKTSLSIGAVARLSSLEERKISIAELLEQIKSHPAIMPLLEGAILKEYSGHLVPEGGIKIVPRLFGDGVLIAGDAAGFLSSTGLRLEGMNLAIASGYAAAQAVKKARERGDFSKNGLSCYRTYLETSLVLPTLRTFRHAPDLLANPRLFNVYPSILCGVLRGMLVAEAGPRRKVFSLIRAETKGKVSPLQLIKDIFDGGRALLW